MNSGREFGHSAPWVEPRCRNCGNAVPKKLRTYWFGCSDVTDGFSISERMQKPADKQDAQRFVDGTVVAVRYWGELPDRYVRSASVWDGKSYSDEFFCCNACTTEFAYSCAKSGAATQAYTGTMARRYAEEAEKNDPQK